MSSSECQVCYTKADKYTIQCGSTTPHKLCFDCEREWRLKSKPTLHGRLLICPFCRGEEKEPGLRSRSSYEAELQLLYQELYSRSLVSRAAQRAQRVAPPHLAAVVRAVPPETVAEVILVRPPSPPYVPRRTVYRWCKNRSIACVTQSTTARKCTYPGGCTENVCRQCKMCVNHFQAVS
jgi:hypothetical protein